MPDQGTYHPNTQGEYPNFSPEVTAFDQDGMPTVTNLFPENDAEAPLQPADQQPTATSPATQTELPEA